jgi:predicted dehydrogenase
MPYRFAALVGLVVLILGSSMATLAEPPPARKLRAGMVGCDTSHAPAFAKLMNKSKLTPELAIEVVAAFPEASPDLPASRDRLAGFVAQLRDELGIAIVASMEELLQKVDVVLVESVDGRPHLRQARAALLAGKPVFIDKPLAGSLADAVRLVRDAKTAKVPCFSASGLRFSPGIAGARNNPQVGEVVGAMVYSPAHLEEHHPDLFWYGIHGVETLFTIMGPGCERVTRVSQPGVDVVTGVWKDGRVGTFRGLRAGKQDYGGLVFGTKGIVPTGGFGGYEPLVKALDHFFRTGQAPVSLDETLEIHAFMEAADESKRRGGVPVTLAEVLQAAERAGE